MVSLSQIMETIFAESAFQRIPAKQDHAVQAFLFDGTYEALRVRIAVRRFWGNRDDVHIVFLQDFLKLSCLFRISVDDEVRIASKKAVVERREVERDLFHEDSVWVWCGCREMDPAGLQLNDEKNVERDQTRGSPELGSEEFGSSKSIAVSQ